MSDDFTLGELVEMGRASARKNAELALLSEPAPPSPTRMNELTAEYIAMWDKHAPSPSPFPKAAVAVVRSQMEAEFQSRLRELVAKGQTAGCG